MVAKELNSFNICFVFCFFYTFRLQLWNMVALEESLLLLISNTGNDTSSIRLDLWLKHLLQSQLSLENKWLCYIALTTLTNKGFLMLVWQQVKRNLSCVVLLLAIWINKMHTVQLHRFHMSSEQVYSEHLSMCM